MPTAEEQRHSAEFVPDAAVAVILPSAPITDTVRKVRSTLRTVSRWSGYSSPRDGRG
ncbi:MAG: hypothetical protein AVDCRST_MAG19-4263 [uncultured Thermomicrobiales bacterium]|uniref:Uncharacterized protein n=1 Tax=uncultured Thermomicrobiales bacterium TaxID=1645740 RepID=A0A6J4VN39_9BACT|nr:MAG: hypothetical protein AVDCRST_MAG19-4263 [uncultured Thermomicrobiales bacterium]